MSAFRTRLRWRIAGLMGRLPGQCWADLVSWALHNSDDVSRLPWRPQDSACRTDAKRCGTCYCGKVRAPGADQTGGA